MSDRDDLIAFIRAEAVFHGDFVLTSGKRASYYIDLRKVSLDHRVAPLIGRVMLDVLAEFEGVDAVGGMTMGADPISLAIGMYSAADSPLGVFTVRKEPKDHGRGKRIEGNFTAGDSVIVVDDVITTGGSTIKAIDAIKAEGGKVVAAFVLVDREEGGREAIEGRGVPVHSLFTRRSIFGDK